MMHYPPIPLDSGRIEGWKSLPVKEGSQSDLLVPLGPFSQEAGALLTSSVYFGEHTNSPYAARPNMLNGSLLTIFARQSVARRLLAAEQLLPAGHHLLIFDAFRPYQVQESLYNFYRQKLKEKHPDIGDGALDTETQKYVAFPSQDPARPSQHVTGGAVDVVIVKLDQVHEEELSGILARLADGSLTTEERSGLEIRRAAIMRYAKMLNFGTAFDYGGEKAAPMYYEVKIAAGEILDAEEMQACNNRRLLHYVMTKAGFQPYFAEWWHFNAPETQTGAVSAGYTSAAMGAAELSKSNMAHEKMRFEMYRKLPEQLKTAGNWPIEVIAPPEE